MAFLLLGLALCGVCFSINNRPVIGIYGLPHKSGGDYLAASYVKWIESAGGRVVPLPFHISNEHAKGNVSVLNGLLFPGGAVSVPDEAKFLYNHAVEQNQAGDYFPIFGICLGFEWIMQMQGGISLDTGFDSENISLPLELTPAAGDSRMFDAASSDLMTIFGSENVTMNNHGAGITPEKFDNTTELTSFFAKLSTNKDRNGKAFVSTVESRHVPVYATQWHPEKNQFEFGASDKGALEAINHSWDAVQAGQHMANFFVQEARKSDHHFPSQHEENAALVWNYPLVNQPEDEFVQIFKLF